MNVNAQVQSLIFMLLCHSVTHLKLMTPLLLSLIKSLFKSLHDYMSKFTPRMTYLCFCEGFNNQRSA